MKVTFYCNIYKSALSIVEFYKQDIEILQELGCQVLVTNKYREIDWSSDLIFIWWWTYAFYPVLIAKLLGKKTIITGTFNYWAPQSPMDYFRRPFWQRCLIKFSMKNASCNIMVSKKEFQQIKHGWKYKNISYSPHVVEIDKYKPGFTVREKYLFSIIWTGKINLIRKCLPEIIESAKILVKKYSAFKLFIAGSYGDGFNDVKKMIDQLKLSENIILLGEISEKEKIKYLQNCMIYLQPSRYEGFGLAIAEAMSCGAPIIASDTGEVKNLVGDAGLLLSGYQPEEIVAAIELLINDPDLRTNYSHKARRRIANKFHFDIRKNDIKKIIEKLF
jgi:glycosyltransferase involved in cell wall biosynthesis